MRSSLRGTDNASACDSRVNAQQSRAGSELLELNVWYAEGPGSVELLIDRLRRRLSGVNLPIRCCPTCCPTQPWCCPLRPRVVRLPRYRKLHCLGGLLILAFVRFGEFDGEEGLDAGMQVERFTGPTGLDGASSGMLEAIHSS